MSILNTIVEQKQIEVARLPERRYVAADLRENHVAIEFLEILRRVLVVYRMDFRLFAAADDRFPQPLRGYEASRASRARDSLASSTIQ